MTSNVPKFASFRPKPKAAPEPSKETRKPSVEERPSKEKARTKTTNSSQSERPASSRDVLTSKIYFSDRRGDSDIRRYGTLNRYDIPAYRRYGHGLVLGLSPDQKIDRDYTTDTRIRVAPVTRPRQQRLLLDKHLNKSTGRTLRLLKAGRADISPNLEYVALSSTGKRPRDDSDTEDEGTAHIDYRGIESKRKPTEPEDLDTQYESDPETIRIDTQTTSRNSELVRRTREHPQDLPNWLAFIDHQDAMLRLDRPSSDLTDADKTHLADVRISIFEEALKKIGKDPDSQAKLYEGLLSEARRAWSETKLASKWKEVLSKHPHNFTLWFMYLDFVQSSFATFKYEDCRSTFLECLKSLRAGTEGIAPEDILHILLRLTCIIQDSGYQELALAIWQALMDFHLFRNEPSAKVGAQDAISAFAEFWESEAPRIGEEGANGWINPTTSNTTPSSAINLPTSDSSDSVFEDFRKRELDAIGKLRYPGRTSDESGDDDAFHTIFFSDVEDYMKIIPAATSHILIIQAFLCFCGLPPLSDATQQQKWWSDPFLRRQLQCTSGPQDQSSHFKRNLSRFSNCPLKSCQMTSELLFEQDFDLHGARLSPSFVRRALKLWVTNSSCGEIVSEFLLAFELRHFPMDAFKTAKQLLKGRPSSLRLYNAYGLLESRRGNTERADQVFSMALSMQNGNIALSTPGSVEIFSSWTWEALHRGEQIEALWRLVSPTGKVSGRDEQNDRPTHDQLQRAHAILSETSERALLRQDYHSAILATSLLALLCYLSNDCNPEPAMVAHQNLSSWFVSNKLLASPFAELHAQQIARFLIHHTTNAPIVKPALIRNTLEPLISLFPSNTVLLACYAANEARFSIDDRVRNIMHQTALRSSDTTSVVGWAFAIHYETLKGEIAGSTSHSIRALYKRATDGTGAHCPALWQANLRFELQIARQELVRRSEQKLRRIGKKGNDEARASEAEARVKERFYQGLRHLPWCKDFIMLAFTEAREFFTEEELWRLYRILTEKELRLYVELNEPEL
ncbi:Nn.00g009370.m01.CDS01 [Neocucurbitaria sp. VM-36]